MSDLMMCLSCGKQFKTTQEAIDHNEFYLREEARTTAEEEAMYGRSTKFGEPSKIIRRHIVQISGPLGVKNGNVGVRG
jgi:hypothetical protein